MTQTFARLDVPPAYKVVYEAIETEIMAGRLKPGDQLPTETALAEQFGVNRSTVREGIRLLEQSGLVRREAGRRLHVSLPHYTDLAPRVSRAMVMQRVTFRELWEVCMVLEPQAAVDACEKMTPEKLAALERNRDAMEEALKAGNSITALDVQFHALVAEATENKALLLAREPYHCCSIRPCACFSRKRKPAPSLAGGSWRRTRASSMPCAPTTWIRCAPG